MISVFKKVNNVDALVLEEKFIYTGDFNDKREPDGIGRLTIKDGGLYFKGYFDLAILQEKIDELKKLTPKCSFCFDKGEVECVNCKGELISTSNDNEILKCAYCDGTGLIKCSHC